MYALQNKQISKKQYHEAYIIAHQLMIEIEDNFSEIQDKVMRCYHKINHKAQKMKHKRPYKAKRNHIDDINYFNQFIDDGKLSRFTKIKV